MKLRSLSLPLLLVALLLIPLALGFAKAQQRWPAYLGAWFRVEYPPGFTLRPGMDSLTSGDGHDSAFFLSPDRQVEFYVFSPQWYGEPTDILLNPKTEKLLSSKTKLEKAKGSWSQSSDEIISETTWQTIRAKDGSYTRSYVNIIHGPSARGDLIGQRTFGLRYATHRAYEKYKAGYVRFKESLEQYAD